MTEAEEATYGAVFARGEELYGAGFAQGAAMRDFHRRLLRFDDYALLNKSDVPVERRPRAHRARPIAQRLLHASPLRFAAKNFDALGRERSEDNGQPVDTASSYAFSDGARQFADGNELSNILAGSTQVHTCYAKRSELRPGA